MSYRGLAEVAATAAALGARPIGVSRGGRAIVAMTFGTRGPATLVVAGVHPLEWIGVEVALAIAARCAAAPPVDRRVIVVPVVCVDGYAAVEADARAGRRRWRRTASADGRSGVDLNRNFPVAHRSGPGWWARVPHGGAAPWSEPETAALAALLDGEGAPPIDRALSLHSFGKMILLPWAHQRARPPHYPELAAHARTIAAQLSGYRTMQAGRWPLAGLRGLELDWLTSRGALTLLVECSGGGLRLGEPRTWTRPFDWYNPQEPAGHVEAIATAVAGFVRGAPAR